MAMPTRDFRLFSMQAVRVASLLLLLSSHTAYSADKGVEKTSPYPSSFITPKFPGDEDHIGTPPVSSDSSPKSPQFSGTPNIPVPPEDEKEASSSGGASANSTHIDLAKLSISEPPLFPINIPAVRDNIKNIHPRLLARLFFSPLVANASVENGDLDLKTQHMYKQAYALWHQLINLLDYLEQADTPLDSKTVGHSLTSYYVLANLILQTEGDEGDNAAKLEQLMAENTFQDTLKHFGNPEHNGWDTLRQNDYKAWPLMVFNDEAKQTHKKNLHFLNERRQEILKMLKASTPYDGEDREDYTEHETDFIYNTNPKGVPYEVSDPIFEWDSEGILSINESLLPEYPFTFNVSFLPIRLAPSILSMMFAKFLLREATADAPTEDFLQKLAHMRLHIHSTIFPFEIDFTTATLDIISNALALLTGHTPLLFPDKRHNRLNHIHMANPIELQKRLASCQRFAGLLGTLDIGTMSEELIIEQSKLATIHRSKSNQPLEQLLQEYDKKLQSQVQALLLKDSSSWPWPL